MVLAGAECGAKRWKSALQVLLVPLVILLVASPGTLLHDVMALMDRPWLVLILPAIVGFGAFANKWMPSTFGAGVAISLLSGAALFLLDRAPQARYLLSGLAVLAVGLPAVASSWLTVGLVWLVGKTAVESVPNREFESKYTVVEGQVLAKYLTSHGIAWPETTLRIIASNGHNLQEATVPWLPLNGKTQTTAAVYVLPRDASPLPPGSVVLSDRFAAHLRPSRLHWEAAQLCYDGTCQAMWTPGPDEGVTFQSRYWAKRLPLPQGTGRFELVVPVRKGPPTHMWIDRYGDSSVFHFCHTGPETAHHVVGADATNVRLCADLSRPHGHLFGLRPLPPIVFETAATEPNVPLAEWGQP